MDKLRWMRVFGDTTFAVGALVLGYFVVGLVTGHSYDKRRPVLDDETRVAAVSLRRARARRRPTARIAASEPPAVAGG